MRLPVDRFLPLAAPIFACVLLSSCGGGAHSEIAPGVSGASVTAGPGADYPIVVGQPFTIDGVIYTPADRMNVDQVGYAYAGAEGGEAISAAHRTLPVPSYVEVTSLDTGKTILVRVERRGPMSGDGLVELSPGAVAQLGANPAGKTPVRVRRVNPPEPERAALRNGQRAPDRMETPKSLVAVLLRKLSPALPGAAPSPSPSPSPELGTKPLPSLAVISGTPKPNADARPARPAPAASRPTATPPVPAATSSPRGRHVIQVGAFSSKANAEATAAKVGGTVSPAGRLWRVRMGPYVASETAAALAKAKAAGYSDARIQRAD